VGILLLAEPRAVAVVAAFSALAKLSENFLQRGLADGLLAFGSDAQLARAGVVGEIAPVFEVLNEIADTVFVIGQSILPIQLVEPRQRLQGIARRVLQQLHKQLQQLIEAAPRQAVRYVFRKVKTAHMVCRRYGFYDKFRFKGMSFFGDISVFLVNIHHPCVVLTMNEDVAIDYKRILATTVCGLYGNGSLAP